MGLIRKYWPLLGMALLALLLVWMIYRAGQQDAKRQAWEHRADSVMGVARRAYQDTTQTLQLVLATTEARRAGLELEARAARLAAERARARVDTVRVGFAQDTTARDSLGTALQVIAAQDTALVAQDHRIQGLEQLVAADSGLRRLFVAQRVQDSTRIDRLEATLASRPGQHRFLGLRLPAVHCIGGLGVGLSLAGQATGPLVLGCGVGY